MGLGDLAAAARVLMAVPAHRRARLMQAMIAEATLARRHWQRTGRLHPVFGNGTLMSAALARAHPAMPGRVCGPGGAQDRDQTSDQTSGQAPGQARGQGSREARGQRGGAAARTGDDYLSCLADVLEAVIAWRAACEPGLPGGGPS